MNFESFIQDSETSYHKLKEALKEYHSKKDVCIFNLLSTLEEISSCYNKSTFKIEITNGQMNWTNSAPKCTYKISYTISQAKNINEYISEEQKNNLVKINDLLRLNRPLSYQSNDISKEDNNNILISSLIDLVNTLTLTRETMYQLTIKIKKGKINITTYPNNNNINSNLIHFLGKYEKHKIEIVLPEINNTRKIRC